MPVSRRSLRHGLLRSPLLHLVLTIALVTSALATLSPAPAASASTPPTGFVQDTIATDIQNPVGMEISPDGRLFVLAGNQRRIEVYDGTTRMTDFLSLPQAANLGSGLLGLAFTPDFATSGEVLVAYVTNPVVVTGPQRFRLSRFSSDGDVADPASETVLFEVEDIDPTQQQHQGGDVAFGPDGKIWWPLGDRVEGTKVAQPYTSLFGKVLRLNPDGSIPSDNPFYDTLDGDFRAIAANGLRNPYRTERHPVTGELYMSEVGPKDFEEINRVVAGANYGWPMYSGPTGDPTYTDPVHHYSHTPDGCAITGLGFYSAQTMSFPAAMHGDMFYGDHCFGWIDRVDMTTGEVDRFLTGAHRLVEVKIHPLSGELYFLDREYNNDQQGSKGGVGRVRYVGGTTTLEITGQPQDATAAVGQQVELVVEASGAAPLTYRWMRDGETVADSDSARLMLPPATAQDDGASFTVEVTDGTGASLVSDPAVLHVTANAAPVPEIVTPSVGSTYVGGDTIAFQGRATDADDGDLSAAALSWAVDFHHGEHTHPVINELDGTFVGSFPVPTNDETAPDVFFRITLTATDAQGVSTSVSRDVMPVHADVTLATSPSGLGVLLDGGAVPTPTAFTGVANVNRALEAPQTVTSGGSTWEFVSWSNGGARSQILATPAVDTTYTATYREVETTTDELPSTTIDTPAGGSVVIAPATITGTANDDHGVERVQLIIKKAKTRLYWDGTAFTDGWSAVDATLSNPGATSTTWSLPFTVSEDTAVRIVARPFDSAGQRGASQSVNATFVTSEPSPPEVAITSPSHRDTVPHPVTVEGTVADDIGADVFLVVKQKGVKLFWNGSGWQSGWVRIDAPQAGDGTWSRELLLPEPTDLVVFAEAVDTHGLKTRSDSIVIFATPPTAN